MSARCPDGHGPNTICGYCVELTGATLEVVQAAAQALRAAYGSRAVAGVEAVAAVAVVKAIAPALKAAGRAEAAAELRDQPGTITSLAIAYVNAPEGTDECSDAWYELEAAVRHLQGVTARLAEGADRG